MIRTPPPSPITKPSRSLSKGRLAPGGSSLRVESALAALNPAMERGVIGASTPPVIIARASPRRIIQDASPIAWALVEQALTIPMLGPLAPVKIDTIPDAILEIII